MASTPGVITDLEVSTELERTGHYLNFAEALATTEERYGFDKDQFAKVMPALKLPFESGLGETA